MPRKSASSLSVVPIGDRLSRLCPPPCLSEEERAVFLDIVSACDPKHFRRSDLPLLIRYVESCALADSAAQHLRVEGAVSQFGKPSPWLIAQEKAIRSMIALSMRLRLAPQSRIDPKTLGRQRPNADAKPWEDKRA